MTIDLSPSRRQIDCNNSTKIQFNLLLGIEFDAIEFYLHGLLYNHDAKMQ